MRDEAHIGNCTLRGHLVCLRVRLRDARQFRQRLPVPWMRAVSASADVVCFPTGNSVLGVYSSSVFGPLPLVYLYSDNLKEITHVFCPPIHVHGCARGYIVPFAVRADSATITHSTSVTATEVSTEMYGQRHLCQQQGRNSKAP